jgi:hypothetical protein
VTRRAGPPFRLVNLRLVNPEPFPAPSALPPARQVARIIVALHVAEVAIDFLDDIWITTGSR